jgi:hypothetical protein
LNIENLEVEALMAVNLNPSSEAWYELRRSDLSIIVIERLQNSWQTFMRICIVSGQRGTSGWYL